MHKLLFVIFFKVILISSSLSQGFENSQSYVIFTIERERNKDMHGKQFFYAILPIDSIRMDGLSIAYPFFLDNFYRDKFDRCCEGKAVNFNTMSTDSRYEFDSAFISGIESLKLILDKRKILIQTIKKSWLGGFKERLYIYASPIKGNFCKCEKQSEKKPEIAKLGYLPVSSFSYVDSFWKSKESSLIKKLDFSQFAFSFFE